MARIARALDTLRTQVNAAAPNRGKGSDGWIGDAAHQATGSDHNPNSAGVVTALDITHDPAHGFNSWEFADMLRARRDPRIKYVISNSRIFAGASGPSPWAWRKYTGSNSHAHHVHVSVLGPASLYDDSKPWDIGGDWNANKDTPAPIEKPLLRRGSPHTAQVTELQRKLGFTGLDIDGQFGPKTEAAVKKFQASKGLVADGLVGIYTREALGM